MVAYSLSCAWSWSDCGVSPALRFPRRQVGLTGLVWQMPIRTPGISSRSNIAGGSYRIAFPLKLARGQVALCSGAQSQSSRGSAGQLNPRTFALGVDLGDVAFRFRASTPARLAAITDPAYGMPTSLAQAQCDVRYVSTPPSVPSTGVSAQSADVDVWQQGSKLYLEHKSGLRAWARTSTAEIGGTDREGVLAPVLHRVVTHLVGHQGRYLIHAGAIANRSAAYLVMGDSGLGKSTLALAALRSGWKLLSDDLSLLRLSASRIEVWGVPRPPSVPMEVASESRDFGVEAPDWRGRLTLSPDCLSQGWLPVGGVILSGHADGPLSQLRAITGPVVREAALRAFVSISPVLLKRWLAIVDDISSLPKWKLLHGTDPDTRVAGAGRLLRKVDAEASRRPPRKART